MIGGDHSGTYKFCASVRVTGVGKVTGKLENALCMVPAEIFCFEARNKIVARQFSFNGLSGRTSENEPVLSLPGPAGASVKVRTPSSGPNIFRWVIAASRTPTDERFCVALISDESARLYGNSPKDGWVRGDRQLVYLSKGGLFMSTDGSINAFTGCRPR